MGLAIQDFAKLGRAQRLRVLSSMFYEDEIPVHNLFRTEAEMPLVERTALALSQGRVLDVGAGAGCHTLALQRRGLDDVTAIDISALSVETMRERGVRQALCADFFTDDFGSRFDTLLMLMNGLGIAGTLDRLPLLLSRCRELLADGGCVLADSTDLCYLFEDESGHVELPEDGVYYGEVDYRMVYGRHRGPAFHWLYVDFDTLCSHAAAAGLQAELVVKGTHYHYLARLSRA